MKTETVEALAVVSWKRCRVMEHNKRPAAAIRFEWDCTSWEFFGIWRAARWEQNHEAAELATFLSELAFERRQSIDDGEAPALALVSKGAD